MSTSTDPGSEHGLTTRLIVGMEIHVELATRTKMWTAAPNLAHPDHFDAPPNSLLDPLVIGMPGTLPVMNKAAVEMSLKVGLALGCNIATRTKWDRKSYYYPDLPKNYQISQYDLPLCYGGSLELDGETIGITRAHLEEDAGKLLHELPSSTSGISRTLDGSIVDLNRAGTPLLEIVTEPDLTSAEGAVKFGQTLRDLCRHLDVTEGIMQKGHMRFEPNINVEIERDGKVYKTPIVEIKNLNSFRAVQGAIEHEHRRQVEAWLETGEVMKPGAKSTRGWDDVRLVTVLQREKEEAHDYRYFPDPDLVEVAVDEAWVERVRAALPEPPHTRFERYRTGLGLSEKDAAALIDEPAVTRFFEKVLSLKVEAKRATALLLNYGAKRANERGVRIDELGITPEQVAGIAVLIEADKIGSSAADELFGYCCDPKSMNKTAEELAEEHGLLQVSDTSALEGYIDQVLADPKNAKAIEDIRGGKDKAVGMLLGGIMKLSGGQANPKLVREMILERVRG